MAIYQYHLAHPEVNLDVTPGENGERPGPFAAVNARIATWGKSGLRSSPGLLPACGEKLSSAKKGDWGCYDICVMLGITPIQDGTPVDSEVEREGYPQQVRQGASQG